MGDVNDKTIDTYIKNFEKYSEKTPSKVEGDFKKWMDLFLSYIPKGKCIFELGSATGRDAQYFKNHGYDVFCTDIAPQALKDLKGQGFKVSNYDFRTDPLESWKNNFSAVFANAVLLHAKKEDFKNVLIRLLSLLKKNGILAFSLKTGSGEKILSEKMDAPRYFKFYTEKELRNIIQGLPCEILRILSSDDEKWLQVIIKKK